MTYKDCFLIYIWLKCIYMFVFTEYVVFSYIGSILFIDLHIRSIGLACDKRPAWNKVWYDFLTEKELITVTTNFDQQVLWRTH